MNKTIFIFRKLFKNYTNKIKNTNKINNSRCFYVDIICIHTNCRIYYDTKNATLEVIVELNNKLLTSKLVAFEHLTFNLKTNIPHILT